MDASSKTLVPLSLPRVLVERALRAVDRGLGIRPEDVDVFLAACERENFAVCRCDVWLADHRAAFDGDPIPADAVACAHPLQFPARTGAREMTCRYVK